MDKNQNQRNWKEERIKKFQAIILWKKQNSFTAWLLGEKNDQKHMIKIEGDTNHRHKIS